MSWLAKDSPLEDHKDIPQKQLLEQLTMESVIMSPVCSYELVEGVSCNKELPVLLVMEILTFL